jgi:hypothetical protein
MYVGFLVTNACIFFLDSYRARRARIDGARYCIEPTLHIDDLSVISTWKGIGREEDPAHLRKLKCADQVAFGRSIRFEELDVLQ